MNGFSVVIGVLAIGGLLVGFVPLLGWLNWFVTIPLALIGAVLGALSRQRGGLQLNLVVLGLAALRLFLGGGIL